MTYFTSPSRANITKGNLLFKVSIWFKLNRSYIFKKNKFKGLVLSRIFFDFGVWFVKLVRKKFSSFIILEKVLDIHHKNPSAKLVGIHDEYEKGREALL